MLFDSRNISSFANSQAKFIRVGNEIYIIGPEENLKFHIELAKKEKVLERIEVLKVQNPDSVDGGQLFFSGKLIRVGLSSTTLDIPLTEKAREITLQVLKKHLPDYSIKSVSDV